MGLHFRDFDHNLGLVARGFSASIFLGRFKLGGLIVVFAPFGADWSASWFLWRYMKGTVILFVGFDVACLPTIRTLSGCPCWLLDRRSWR